jgi:phospholipid-binding lipoprotein MlaA
MGFIESSNTLSFSSNKLLIELCGQLDTNLSKIESWAGVQIVRRGNALSIYGAKADCDLTRKLISNLYLDLERGSTLDQRELDIYLQQVEDKKFKQAQNKKSDEGLNKKEDNLEIKTQKKLVMARSRNQNNFIKSINDFGRFIFNTTFGIFGLFDVATPMGFDKNNEDFGQTLGKWGVESGPYIVLPFLGPTNLRDALSRGVDSVISPLAVAEDHPTYSGLLTGLNILNQTTVLLDLDDFVSGDKYIFYRDAFLQRRKYEISDGEINFDDLDDEFEDF